MYNHYYDKWIARLLGWLLVLLLIRWLILSSHVTQMAIFVGFYTLPHAVYRWRCRQCNRFNSRLVQVCDHCHTPRA